MTCEECGGEVSIGDFPFCHGDATKHAPMEMFGVVGDDIPGGLEIKHALCHADGTPRKFYSKKEIAKEAKARGYENHVCHVTAKGTDKAPHTQRFV